MGQPGQPRATATAGAPLSMADYARIHGLARTVLEGLNGKSNAHAACIFFSIVGAAIMEEHHRLPATAKVGAAFFSLGGTPLPDVLAFASPTPTGVVSDINGFHCWVECGGWAVDFMAPLFQDSVPPNRRLVVPAKMFQRPLSSMAASFGNDDLADAGSFFLDANPALIPQIFGANLAKPQFQDFVEICRRWYRPSPAALRPKLLIGSNDGTQRELTLRIPSLVGAW